MRKLSLIIAMTFLILSLTACSTKSYEIALITVYDDINDGSFNQATWEGIKEYAVKNGITHQYYQPLSSSEKDYIASITQAVKAGAKIVITPGLFYGFEEKFPETQFVILDSVENAYDESKELPSNVLTIFFRENESGFLAGYAAVKDGFDNLGFIGGMQINTVKKFGIGFIAGAYFASNELNKKITFESNHYSYVNTFSASEEVQSLAASWYDEGVSVIHAAAGGAGYSVIEAANHKRQWVIGVDSDQSKLSDQVITSAVKSIGYATYRALSAFYEKRLTSNQVWILGADENAISLPMDTSKFENFDNDAYEFIFNKIKNDEIKVPENKIELKEFLESINVVNLELVEKV